MNSRICLNENRREKLRIHQSLLLSYCCRSHIYIQHMGSHTINDENMEQLFVAFPTSIAKQENKIPPKYVQMYKVTHNIHWYNIQIQCCYRLLYRELETHENCLDIWDFCWQSECFCHTINVWNGLLSFTERRYSCCCGHFKPW